MVTVGVALRMTVLIDSVRVSPGMTAPVIPYRAASLTPFCRARCVNSPHENSMIANVTSSSSGSASAASTID